MASRLKDLSTSVAVVIEPDTAALVAAQIMRQHHTNTLVVVDDQEPGRPVGIVTENDLVSELVAVGIDPARFTNRDVVSGLIYVLSTLVRVAPPVFTAGDVMSEALGEANTEMDVLDAVALMRLQHWRGLVISDAAARPLGVVTADHRSAPPAKSLQVAVLTQGASAN